MSITQAIELLKTYNGPLELTLHEGASEGLINKVEHTYGFSLPADFKTFNVLPTGLRLLRIFSA